MKDEEKDGEKKVLLATPITDRNLYMLEKWLDCITSFDYVNYDVFLIYLGDFKGGLSYNYIKEEYPEITIRVCPEDSSEHIMRQLANIKNYIRSLVLTYDYDFWFKIDPDTILPKNCIKKFVSYNKDCVSALSSVGYLKWRVPWVMRSGKLVAGSNWPFDFYTPDEIKEHKKKHGDGLMPCYYAGMGQTLIKKDVLETMKIRCDFTRAALDVQMAWQFNKMGFECFVDLGMIAEHNNVPWTNLGGYIEKDQVD